MTVSKDLDVLDDLDQDELMIVIRVLHALGWAPSYAIEAAIEAAKKRKL